MNKTNAADNNLALFLGLWFDIFPCPFTELSRAVKPGIVRKEDLVPPGDAWWKDNNNEKFNLQKEMGRAWGRWRKDHSQNNSNSEREGQRQTSLAPSIPGLGGVCPTGNNLETILKNYFAECLSDEFSRGGKTVQRVAHHVAGLQADHRAPWRFGNEIAEKPESYDFVPLLGATEDAVMCPLRYRGSRIVKKKVNSLTSLLAHVENLGHAPALFVEGLNVELLPFQLQSLQWAIERELIPGGVQSLHWARVPLSLDAEQELYFNPMLGMFSTIKPANVRGGVSLTHSRRQ